MQGKKDEIDTYYEDDSIRYTESLDRLWVKPQDGGPRFSQLLSVISIMPKLIP